MARILVTGGLGFVGKAVTDALHARGDDVVISTRRPDVVLSQASSVQVASLGPKTDWSQALEGVDTVVHLAARVHVMRETATDPLTEFRNANVIGTEVLIRAAAAAGVSRIVFLSTVKVNGERTTDLVGMTESDIPSPEDPYAVSKMEAEKALRRIAVDTGIEIVILRPPLVYGPDVGGNFVSLLRLVHSGIPLPFGATNNLRSFVYVGNLADAIAVAARHPGADGETFLLSDGEPVSTSALIRAIAEALGVRARLIPVPPALLRVGAGLTGRSAQASRLLDSLVVDDHKIADNLDWKPPFTMQAGLELTARRYLETKSLDNR